MRADRRPMSPWPRLVWGVTLLAAGIIFWLDRIGRIEARDYLEWWPLAVIAGGLAHVPQRKWAAAAIWIVIGLFFLLPMIGLPQMPLWRVIGLWPLLFSVAGAMLIAQAMRRPEKIERGTTFRAAAVMASNNQRVMTEGLAGGEAVAIMGGCVIELLRSANPPSEIVIDVLVFWGGTEVRVPSGWRIENHVTPILGGVDDKTSAPVENAPRVVLRGAAIMGGVEVKNVAEGSA